MSIRSIKAAYGKKARLHSRRATFLLPSCPRSNAVWLGANQSE